MQNVKQDHNEQDLLGDFEINPQQASTGKRFANYLIDLAIFYIIVRAIGVSMIPGTMTMGESQHYVNTSLTERILLRLVIQVLYGIYMFLIEGLFRGKSPGKFITRTRAVNEDGSHITARTSFLRNISRTVPFEQFSAFGSPCYPWHDRWTHTYVIDEKRSTV